MGTRQDRTDGTGPDAAGRQGEVPVAHQIETLARGPVTVVRLLSEKVLDEAVVSDIYTEVHDLMKAAPDMRHLVLDLSEVRHMSSSALGMLITLHKRIRERDGKLALVGIRPAVYEVFAITRLNEIFSVFQTVGEAVEALSPGKPP